MINTWFNNMRQYFPRALNEDQVDRTANPDKNAKLAIHFKPEHHFDRFADSKNILQLRDVQDWFYENGLCGVAVPDAHLTHG